MNHADGNDDTVGEIRNVPIFAALAIGPIWELASFVRATKSPKSLQDAKDSGLKLQELVRKWGLPGFDSSTGKNTNAKEFEPPKGKGMIDKRIGAVMRRFYPLAEAIMSGVVETVPREEVHAEVGVDSEEDTIAIVPKYLPVFRSNIVTTVEAITCVEGNDIVVFGFCKVFKGMVREGDRLFVLNGNGNGNGKDEEPIKTPPIHLFIITGSAYSQVGSVAAGKICAIYCPGLENLCPRQAFTLSTSSGGDNFVELDGDRQKMDPILKVSVEAEAVGGMGGMEARNILQSGLRRLGNTDASVSVEISASGEFLLGAIGEVSVSVSERSCVHCDDRAVAREELRPFKGGGGLPLIYPPLPGAP